LNDFQNVPFSQNQNPSEGQTTHFSAEEFG
jgi:hypothetical protein